LNKSNILSIDSKYK